MLMKNYIKHLLLFALTYFIFDKIFFIFLYLSPTLEKDQRLEQLINGKINHELIVMGSSRGARNIIAKQLQDSLKISAFNLSYPGSDIEFHEFLLNNLIKYNKKPKKIVLVLDDPSELCPSQSLNFRLDRLYPLSKYDEINNELIKRGEKSILSKFMMLARINKTNFNLKTKEFSPLDTLLNCGSMPISFQRSDREFSYDSNPKIYDRTNELKVKIRAFNQFQIICQTYNIKLVLVIPPNLKKYNDSFEKRIREILLPNVTLYVYDHTNSVYQDKSYYYDESHLLINGAKIFTSELINAL